MVARRTRLLAYLLGGVAPLCLAGLALGVPVMYWSNLPSRIADHWNLSGRPNGSQPKIVALGIALALVVVGASALITWMTLMLKLSRNPSTAEPVRSPVRSMAGLLATGLMLSGAGTAISLSMTLSNLDVNSWQTAHQDPLGFIPLIAGPLALAAVGVGLVRRIITSVSSSGVALSDFPRLGLTDSEEALWLSGARCTWAAPSSLVGLVGAGVLWLLGGHVLAVSIVAVSLGFLELSSVRVAASAVGVMVRYGPFAWPVTRIPLKRIARAEPLDLAPLSWGYRGSLSMFGTAAVMVRRGPTLRLHLKDNKTLLVTVDDAVTGAALINDQVQRQSRIS